MTLSIRRPSRPSLVGLVCLSLTLACARGRTQQVQSSPASSPDVEFMSGMIGHHAQAIVMSKLAASNGASDNIRLLAERISVGQQDEIEFMVQWLRRRNQPVPPINTDLPAEHFHHGAGHVMMPGMLTAEQMDSLSRSRNRDFDTRFLQYMIQHHNGALAMTQKLFASPDAGQDGEVFRFASDVNADQKVEIARMQSMLERLRRP